MSTAQYFDRLKCIICCLIISLQISGVILARFSDLRYFCWAPNDQHSEYRIDSIVINGRRLSTKEIEARYLRNTKRASGFDERSYAHIWNIILAYESIYSNESRIQIRMKYRINGKQWKEITWNKQ